MAQIVQFNVVGADSHALYAAAAAALAGQAASVLDARQATVFGQSLLGLVVQLEDAEHGALLAALTQALPAAQVTAKVLSEAEYSAHCAEQAAPRQVASLLSKRVTSAQFAALAEILSRQGLAVEGIERLSLATPLEGGERGCLELTLSGEASNPEALRSELLAASSALNMDLAVQAATLERRHRRLAVFDMDSTLIQAEVIDELAKAAGVGERVAAITERAMRGELDFRASFKERLALLKGLDVSVLEQIGAQLRLTDGAEALFAGLHRLGYKTAILSGGFTYFARQIQARLGIDYVFANELEVVDGQCTGVAVEPIVDAQRKADLLRELAAKEGLTLEQTIAVGDGANDLPMLALAGLGVALHAKPLVRQSARHAVTTLGLDGVLYLLGVNANC